MKNTYWTEWAKCASIRALKTFAQAVLGMITVGMTMSEVDWLSALSVGVVAGAYSLLTSLAGLPELNEKAERGCFDVEENDDVDDSDSVSN